MHLHLWRFIKTTNTLKGNIAANGDSEFGITCITGNLRKRKCFTNMAMNWVSIIRELTVVMWWSIECVVLHKRCKIKCTVKVHQIKITWNAFNIFNPCTFFFQKEINTWWFSTPFESQFKPIHIVTHSYLDCESDDCFLMCCFFPARTNIKRSWHHEEGITCSNRRSSWTWPSCPCVC
jgi:hypothetical protein